MTTDYDGRYATHDPTEWTDQDRIDQAEAEARLIAANVCVRTPPPGGSCAQGYDHTGRCDWWNETYDAIVRDAVAAANAQDAGACTRHKPPSLDACTQDYDHVGPCDWFDEANRRGYTIANVRAHLTHDRAQAAYNAVTDKG